MNKSMILWHWDHVCSHREDGETTYRMTQGAELVENAAEGPHITAGDRKRAGGYTFLFDLTVKERANAATYLLLL